MISWSQAILGKDASTSSPGSSRFPIDPQPGDERYERWIGWSEKLQNEGYKATEGTRVSMDKTSKFPNHLVELLSMYHLKGKVVVRVQN